MALRNSKGESVSTAEYKREVLKRVEAKLDAELKSYDRVMRVKDQGPASGRFASKRTVRGGVDKTDVTKVLIGKVRSVPTVVVAVDVLRADELADRMMASLPVVETGNRLAQLVGDCYDTTGVMMVLGKHRPAPVSKQAVEARRKRNAILALQTSDGRWVYPTFQFDDGGVRDDVVKLLAAFGDSPKWSVAAWLLTPAEDLDDLTPVAWLGQGRPLHDVERLAGRTAGRWAA